MMSAWRIIVTAIVLSLLAALSIAYTVMQLARVIENQQIIISWVSQGPRFTACDGAKMADALRKNGADIPKQEYEAACAEHQ